MSEDAREVSDALSLLVTNLRNRLRKLPFEELATQPEYTARDEKFRDRRIWVIVLTREIADGRILVLLRGHVHPFLSTRNVVFDAFVKNPDGTWDTPDDTIADIVDALRHDCDQRAPLV